MQHQHRPDRIYTRLTSVALVRCFGGYTDSQGRRPSPTVQAEGTRQSILPMQSRKALSIPDAQACTGSRKVYMRPSPKQKKRKTHHYTATAPSAKVQHSEIANRREKSDLNSLQAPLRSLQYQAPLRSHVSIPASVVTPSATIC